ncbi:MAG: pyrroline-5-carboxylate reductase [Candidatus Omnitrophota bacterium]|nr:pyrroline-5-carboxylate reductase [Candidatus Omnitrophota bacterium]
MKNTIGIIGFGNMGSAVAVGIKDRYNLYVFDKDKEKTKAVSGIKVAAGIADLVKESAVLILAAKPQDFGALLAEIKSYAREKLIISIAAGISTKHIEDYLGEARVIRAMPNIGVKIGKGIICLSRGESATDKDFDFAKEIFACTGKTLSIEEKMMDAATAVSGSGPAYVCEYLEAAARGLDNAASLNKEDFLHNFQRAAEGLGFSPQEAAFLVNNTFDMTLEILEEVSLSPAQLKNQVASKGGTTEAALAVLHSGGSLEEAVKAALRRAEELSKKE